MTVGIRLVCKANGHDTLAQDKGRHRLQVHMREVGEQVNTIREDNQTDDT